MYLSSNCEGSCRSGWERCTIALVCSPTRHIKNARVVFYMPKKFYCLLSQLFLIHSFYTLFITPFLISLVKSSAWLYSSFYFLCFLFLVTSSFLCSCYLLNTLTVKTIACTTLYKCLYSICNNKYRGDVTTLYIIFLTPIFSKAVLKTFIRDFT